MDSIIGKNHKQASLTINDRALEILLMRKGKSKESSAVTKGVIDLLEDWLGNIYLKDLTFHK